MKLLTDETINFQGLWNCKSTTRARVYRDGTHLTILVSELPNNPGTSVTNSWGGSVDLASQLLKLLNIPESINRSEIVWLEHYPERTGIFPESYDRVFMTWDGKQYRMSKLTHPWKRIFASDIQKLLEGLTLKCQCCGFEQDFSDAEEAFHAGWDAPPHFNLTCCDLCPASIYLYEGSKGHEEIHERWKREGRPQSDGGTQ